MLLRPRVCPTTRAWLLRLGFGLVLALAFRTAPPARAADTHPTQERADRFLSLVNASYQALAYVESEAQWKAATDVTPAHDASAETAGKARAAFVGNPALIQETKQLLLLRRELTDLTVRQLERLLLIAAESPMTNPPLTAARIEAETAQNSLLNRFEFKLAGKTVTANDLDNLLNKSTDLAERRAVWEAAKTSGPALRAGLVKLRDLRNGVAQEMGYSDYFALQVASYGVTTGEMLQLNDDFSSPSPNASRRTGSTTAGPRSGTACPRAPTSPRSSKTAPPNGW